MSKKTDQEWRQHLTHEQYRICRECGTEPPFSGEYLHHKGNGQFVCVACNNPLFNSSTKYDSGSGWPSFWEPIDENAIIQKTDPRHKGGGLEVICAQCESHLGHVFNDGPPPTGLRYCINSVALKFASDSSKDKYL